MRPEILYGSELLCLRENEIAILGQTERSMMSAMCGVEVMDRKNTKELMGMLDL